MDKTPEQDNEVARAAQLSRIRETRNIFLEVFGPPENRTPHGKVVLDTLIAKFGKGIPKNVLDDHGRTDALQTHRRLGHYDVLEAINEIIEWKEQPHVHPSRRSA